MALASKLNQPWISSERIENLVQLEPTLMILGLVVAAGLIYKLFLGRLSDERHKNLRRLFKNLTLHLVIAMSTFVAYYVLTHVSDGDETNNALVRIGSYVGLLSVIAWTIVFVKVSRILLFEYLFFSHMKVGVPLLLVNLFSLLLTLVLAGWLSTELFNVKIGPLLATSAIFSLVLGLALQDTLGNLFAGVAMQFDKPYEIGDWIEITLSNQKWIGQVHEISWRATVLIGLSDESISVPNRLMGQTQISNFSTQNRPICRSQVFRLPHGTNISLAKNTLLRSLKSVSQILETPAPLAYISESTDSWITVKLVYFIRDYGTQWIIGDKVLIAGNAALEEAGIHLASSRLLVLSGEGSEPEPSPSRLAERA